MIPRAFSPYDCISRTSGSVSSVTDGGITSAKDGLSAHDHGGGSGGIAVITPSSQPRSGNSSFAGRSSRQRQLMVLPGIEYAENESMNSFPNSVYSPTEREVTSRDVTEKALLNSSGAGANTTDSVTGAIAGGASVGASSSWSSF